MRHETQLILEADHLYTVQEVADRLHVHVQTVRVWIKRGELGHVRVGRYRHVAENQLAAFINEHREDAL